jgi:hypothetical protein
MIHKNIEYVNPYKVNVEMLDGTKLHLYTPFEILIISYIPQIKYKVRAYVEEVKLLSNKEVSFRIGRIWISSNSCFIRGI